MHYVTTGSSTQNLASLGAVPGLADLQKTLQDALKGVATTYATQYTPYEIYNLFRFSEPLITKEKISEKMKKGQYTAQWSGIRNVLLAIYKVGSGGSEKGFSDFSYNIFKTAYLAACSSAGISPLLSRAAPPSDDFSSMVSSNKTWFIIAGVGAVGLVAALLAMRKKA